MPSKNPSPVYLNSLGKPGWGGSNSQNNTCKTCYEIYTDTTLGLPRVCRGTSASRLASVPEHLFQKTALPQSSWRSLSCLSTPLNRSCPAVRSHRPRSSAARLLFESVPPSTSAIIGQLSSNGINDMFAVTRVGWKPLAEHSCETFLPQTVIFGRDTGYK